MRGNGRPAMDPMRMTRPYPAVTICGRTHRQQSMAPVRLTWSTSFHCVGDVPASGVRAPPGPFGDRAEARTRSPTEVLHRLSTAAKNAMIAFERRGALSTANTQSPFKCWNFVGLAHHVVWIHLRRKPFR